MERTMRKGSEGMKGVGGECWDTHFLTGLALLARLVQLTSFFSFFRAGNSLVALQQLG